MSEKGEELLKYITTQMIEYIEKPREERQKSAAMRREDWSRRWFGMVPLSMKMTMGKWKQRQN